MKYIFLLIIFSGFAINTFAQKDEKLRFQIIDSEQTDSAYLRKILQLVYFAALHEKLKAYNNFQLSQNLNINNLMEVGKYYDTAVILSIGEDICYNNYDDTIICTQPNPASIESFSIQYLNYQTFPSSISIEFGRHKDNGFKDQDFWIAFSELNKILTQKQISALLESTKYLPLIEDY